MGLILALYMLLILPTVSRQGISWDEQNDLWIAQSYLVKPNGWLVGSDIDPSQARLPMFIVALVYHIVNRSDLMTARLVSVFVGGLTLVGIYCYGLLNLDARRGWLAAGLLATSPFFLAFARVAFTETDIYLACLFVWLMVVKTRAESYSNVRRILTIGVLLGLGLSAKFTTLAIFPAAWVAIVKAGEGKKLTSRLRDVALVTAMALATSLLLPPEHLTNPDILRSLWQRFRYEMPHPLSFIGEAAALHLLAIVLKSGVVIGVGMMLSLILSLSRLRDERLNFPMLLALCYFAGLLALPLAQTFYMVPLLPILAILTANQFFRLWDSRRRLAVTLAILAVASLGVDLALCYPDFNLNGYQWLGLRNIAGRSSVGYRSIVQTPSDGVQQAFEWLNEHAQSGERVLAYLLEWHIVQATAPNPAYRIENGFETSLYTHPNYVVIHINAQIRQSWWTGGPEGVDLPYVRAWLEENYIKVFTVWRRFGLEMASIWQRKD